MEYKYLKYKQKYLENLENANNYTMQKGGFVLNMNKLQFPQLAGWQNYSQAARDFKNGIDEIVRKSSPTLNIVTIPANMIAESDIHYLVSNETKTEIAEFILTWLGIDGLLLKFVPKEYINNITYLEKALTQNGLAYEFVPILFKKNKKLIEIAINKNPEMIQYADLSLRKDPTFILALIAKYPSIYNHIYPDLQLNNAIAELAVTNNGRLLKNMQAEFKNTEKIVRLAVKNYAGALQYASDDLIQNSSFMDSLVQEHSELLNLYVIGNDLLNRTISEIKQRRIADEYKEKTYQREMNSLKITVDNIYRNTLHIIQYTKPKDSVELE